MPAAYNAIRNQYQSIWKIPQTILICPSENKIFHYLTRPYFMSLGWVLLLSSSVLYIFLKFILGISFLFFYFILFLLLRLLL